MGIKGLLQVFKDASVEKNIEDFAGQRVAVDGYVWMHRAIYNVPQKYEKKYIFKFVEYFETKIETMLKMNMEIYIVWDGDKHPMKKKTATKRYL